MAQADFGADRDRSTQDGLAATLSELARSLQGEPDEAATLDAIVSAAVDNIEGAESGGISLVERKKIKTVAATAPLVEDVDRVQYKFQEGPCVDSIREHRTYRTGDVRAEARWPKFAEAAADAGVGSMLSFQLFTVRDTLGALNLYAEQHEAFSEQSAREGELFAAHAAVALRGSQKESQLRVAVEHRDLIGMAKGILMERENIDQENAFTLLVSASQSANLKLSDVAHRVVTERDRWSRRNR